MPKALSVMRKGDVGYDISKTGLWKDNNIVTKLSTVHTTAMDGEKLSAEVDYNNMKGVDIGDQMESSHLMTRCNDYWLSMLSQNVKCYNISNIFWVPKCQMRLITLQELYALVASNFCHPGL